MEDTGAAGRGRAARPPREGRGGRWGSGGRRGTGCRRAAQGGPCGGPSPALPNGPTSPSKNQVAVKSDQSACPPPRQDRVCVVVPKDSKHGMKTLLWALLNVAKNGERLSIVHVNRDKPISPKGVEEKLGVYVSMCNASKVICDLTIIENGHVAKALAAFIDDEGITKLVMQGASDKRYSEEMKSLEFNSAIKLMKSAPLTCKIWFTCNGQLICTREANATVPAIQPPPVDSHALKMEPVAAVTEAGGLYENNDQQNAMTLPAETVNTEFSEDEIEKSINCLDNRLIGKGGSGNVYKGRLRNTDVAIKKLHRESMQEESDFSRKVAVLGRVRHPNLVTLIGVCREVFGLVYEFLPNGSLQDQLECRNRMAQLKWQVRTKIMREVWTVLTFLHSNKLQPVVHGNLKPSKVLLDSNLACKVEAFGISQSNGIGKPTTQDDVHSFGIIVLQLLTGLLSPDPEDVVKVVEEAMEEKKLHTVLDRTAGEWPTVLAMQLAHIGLRCVSRMSREERPVLAGEVWKLFVAADEFVAASQDEPQAPPDHFKCPIGKEVMVDPHVAPDGHTYELEDINSWFNCGNDTSPVTRQTLPNKNLIPNRAIKSMIEDWNEEQQRQVRTVCDPNPVQSSLQGHPTIPPATQSQALDTSASRRTSTTPTNLLIADARSPTFLPSPIGIRRRHVNDRLPSSLTEADVPGPGETGRIRGKFKHE